MPSIFLILIIILFALAIFDLMVGVSNDAVNFLNSAIGSKVAPRKIIMIIASLGIFIGAAFSSGMMEVARKGIFNPEQFFFTEIMVIFLAVMLTDIILLDVFNSLGMPTSTTVSIVFELLGAAVAVSLLKMNALDQGLSHLGEYINSDKALMIILGILLSVVIAFTIGSLIQYFSRLLFSFRYKKRLRWAGAIWAGIALTSMTYFLLIKGVNGASFATEAFKDWVKSNTWQILLGSFIGWSLLLHITHRIWKFNILRFVVLFGTFSLAMAFAGNDLVNFIGVPIAGFQSFESWQGSGMAADAFTMEGLTSKVPTPTIFLFLSGVIMVITLWFSKKARTVTETEVNLARQTDGAERFKPHNFARVVVRGARSFGKALQLLLPKTFQRNAKTSFLPLKKHEEEKNPPAFDMVRASVNLSVASMLIAFASSLKLPLSTTYVSFMVAMGTSLADKAWGRESAVFRVSGVLNVIGGWFITAIVAFSAAAIFAVIISGLGFNSVFAILALAILLLVRSNLYHRKKENAKAAQKALDKETKLLSTENFQENTAKRIAGLFHSVSSIYNKTFSGLINEDRKTLKEAARLMKKTLHNFELVDRNLYNKIQQMQLTWPEYTALFLQLHDQEQDLLQSLGKIVKAAQNHIENTHNPLQKEQIKQLQNFQEELNTYLVQIELCFEQQTWIAIDDILSRKSLLLSELSAILSHQMIGIESSVYTSRNSLLIFTILLESKDLIAVSARFAKAYQDSEQNPSMELILF